MADCQIAIARSGAIEGEGVHVLPAGGAELVNAICGDIPKEFEPLLPFAAVFRNDSDKEIIAYAVSWVCTNATGKRLRPEIAIFDFSTFRPGSNFPAHTARLVSNLIGLGSGRVPVSDYTIQESTDLLALFKKQQSIVISLDAIVFSDGIAVGPDSNNWIPRWKAFID